MPPAAMIGIGAASGLLGAIGQSQQQKQQNRYMQQAAQAMSPEQIRAAMQQYNPGFYGAFYGNQPGNTGYQQNLYNIMNQPGYMDERLMNLPMIKKTFLN